ncbi:MAG: hypothetical protein ACO2PP_01910 [Thermocrinis sp.]|uniref:hypothetical protein n=1 Tax=Thermocrinis sp. TaxID=2024383 RepID=UPI003C02A0B5
MVKQMTIQHLAAIAAKKAASKGKNTVIFPVNPPYIPPKAGEYQSPYGRIRVKVWLDKENGKWMVKVRFLDTELQNPVISKEVATSLLEKLGK